MEQLVVVIVIGIIGAIKWLMEKSAERRAKQETDARIDQLERENPPVAPRRGPYPIDPFPRPAPDVASRRLREALGLPEASPLPPSHQAPPLPGPTFRVEEVRVLPSADLERRVMKPASFIPNPAAPQFAKKRRQAPAPVQRSSSLDELLRSRDGLRKAILVQEILGTPKGLVF